MYIPATGDWISSYPAGVGQVYRILEDFNEFRYSLEARKERSKRAIVFSKRLFKSAWKPAFRAESFERSIVRPASPEVCRRVGEFLSTNPGIQAAFDHYQPEPISLVVNLTMDLPDSARLQGFGESLLAPEMPQGIPLDRVLMLLTEAGLEQHVGKTPCTATLQLTCHDHEVRDHEFVLRDWRVLAS